MRRLLTCLLGMLSCSVASAAPPEVAWPDGTKADMTSVLKQGTQKDGVRAFAVSEGYRPLSAPRADALPSGAAALVFLGECYIVSELQTTYALVTDKPSGQNPTVLGWVPHGLLLQRQLAYQDPFSKVALKCIAVNTRTFLTESVDGEAPSKLTPPRVRLGPDPNGKDAGTLRFFDFFYVWGNTDPEDPEKGYVLLGRKQAFPRFEPDPAAMMALTGMVGWVEKKRVCFWRTREALQWDDLRRPERTVPGQTHATLGDAESSFRERGATPTSGVRQVVEQFADGKPVPWGTRQMRFPVINFRKEPKGLALPAHPYPGNRLFKVGVIGDVYDGAGRQVMTEQTRQAVAAELDRLRGQLARTEILFVIDRTESMDEYWKATAEAVRRLLDAVAKSDRSLAVGFCYYGDVFPATPQEGKATVAQAVELGGVVPGPLLDAKADAAALQNALDRLADKKFKLPDGNRPEMVYAGLEAGILGAKTWSPYARKMVILIGDDGNHALPAGEEAKVHERLAGLLANSGGGGYETPKEFYALQVKEVSANPNDETVLFRRQMLALTAAAKKREPASRAEYFQNADADRFLAGILRRYEELEQRKAAMRVDVDRIATGQQTKCDDPELAAILQEELRKFNRDSGATGKPLTVADLLAEGGGQPFEERLVWEREPGTNVTQVRHMLLVSGGELQSTVKLFENYFYETENPPTLHAIAKGLLQVQRGELAERADGKPPPDTDQQVLAQMSARYGFTFTNDLISFLGYDKTDKEKLDTKWQPPDESAQRELQYKLQRRFLLLQDILAERVYEYSGPAEKPARLGAGRELRGEARRGFERGEANRPGGPRPLWYWIDAAKEWP